MSALSLVLASSKHLGKRVNNFTTVGVNATNGNQERVHFEFGGGVGEGYIKSCYVAGITIQCFVANNWMKM